MPNWIQPQLRALGDAREQFNVVQTLDSNGLTVQKAAETAGAYRAVPVETFWGALGQAASQFTPASGSG